MDIREQSIPYEYRTKEYPVEVIVTKFQKEEIFVPPYQREFVWDKTRKSRFIESVFLGVPIMPFLVSISGSEAELEIIDGSQRIRTINEYVSGALKLSGLKNLEVLNGTVFGQLPRYEQNKFLLRDFRFHVVTDNATPEVRADIFDRVNTSHKTLSDSEIRKGAYNSPYYQFIQDFAKNDAQLKRLCPLPKTKIDRGEYDELVLRFYAYSSEYLSFKHDVASSLNRFVKKQAKKEVNRDGMEAQLRAVLDFVEKYFPRPYFARPGRETLTPRVRFEAISVGVHLAILQKPDLTPGSMDWLDSEEFSKQTTTDASNNPGRLKGRIEYVRDQLLKSEK